MSDFELIDITQEQKPDPVEEQESEQIEQEEPLPELPEFKPVEPEQPSDLEIQEDNIEFTLKESIKEPWEDIFRQANALLPKVRGADAKSTYVQTLEDVEEFLIELVKNERGIKASLELLVERVNGYLRIKGESQ